MALPAGLSKRYRSSGRSPRTGSPPLGGEPGQALGATAAFVRPLAVIALAVTCLWAGTWIATPTTLGIRAGVSRIDRLHHTRPLTPDQVPQSLAEAVIAVEDQNFHQDHGINVQGLARAAAYDLAPHCTCQGGSTLTEQLAEDLYLNGSDRSIWGRWVDIILALKITDHLTKPQILDAYLSQVYLGDGAVGAAQASQSYFHQPLGKDNLAQLALLAGLPRAPTLLDPFTNPEGARERRAEVLSAMVGLHYISRQQARQANAQPVP